MIEDTIEQLKVIICGELGVDIQPNRIDPEAPLLEDGLKLDSLAIVELITLTEVRFGIQFGEDDLTLDSFASLHALARTIATLRLSAAA